MRLPLFTLLVATVFAMPAIAGESSQTTFQAADGRTAGVISEGTFNTGALFAAPSSADSLNDITPAAGGDDQGGYSQDYLERETSDPSRRDLGQEAYF